VAYADDQRRGVLGHGSVLVQTSLGNRTSPVLRGKWVMEVLLGAPPPPPPPNVPDLEQTVGAKDGKQLTTRERMEMHRANPTCKSCHNFMDPIGLALDNFDVTGKLRFRENGAQLDTRGNLYDGTPINTTADLTKALLVDHLKAARATGDAALRDGRAYMIAPLHREVHARRRPELRSIVRVDDRYVEVRHVAGKCDVELASVAEEELAARRIGHAVFDRAAQLVDKNRSDFVLEAACEKARSVVLDQVFFSLDEDRLQQFNAMLDAPPPPNPGLERRMAV
jgi:uncharacterized protein (DUF1778 family)